MTREQKLRAAYDAGVHIIRAKRPEHKKIKAAIHLYGPNISQVLDGIVAAHEKGWDTVVVHDAKKLEPFPFF